MHLPLDLASSAENPFQYPSSPCDSVQSSASDFSSSSTSYSLSIPTNMANESLLFTTHELPSDCSPLHSHTRLSRNVSTRTSIAHPYARLFAKKDEVKRRKIWNHALEKSLFTPYQLSTLGAPQRRTIYMSSLEAHIDRLHAQLLEIGFWPVAFNELEPYKGLNAKTAKSMVANLQHDASVAKLKLLELERANEELVNTLRTHNTMASDNASYSTPNALII
ncbi:hypothetical protein AX17_000571 [Amanita inopinata Kibby_2008]|nr:hypothetical protein AX17_000571 [Amanita inopinata Kibby_2008]